jgi:hypothetical protein
MPPTYPVPDDFDDPMFRRLYGYWGQRFRGNLLPSRSDIDPVDFPDLLGHLAIIEVLRNGEGTRFRYKLWGTYVTQLYGQDLTGKLVDEAVLPTRAEAIRAAFQAVVDTAQPHFWRVAVPIENREFLSNRRLLLPLASDGVTVDQMLALMVGDPRTD